MSRVTIYNKEYELAYGKDHVLGWFIQVFKNGREEPVENRDNVSVDDAKRIAYEYGFDLSILIRELEHAHE